MMEWFASGGFGMFTVLALGVGSIGYGAKAVRDATPERLAVLRVLPSLVVAAALFSFGIGLWAVNHALEKGLAAKTPDISAIGLIGFTEAAQVITLGGILTVVVLALRVVAEAKGAKASTRTTG
jgi:hypothetical protein